MATGVGAGLIQHIFVLVLENRSFDHMLGFSGITGTDAETQQQSAIRGLSGTESNAVGDRAFTVIRGADYTMPSDPHHEFDSVLLQLCGSGVNYPHGGKYPPIDDSGFVASYISSSGGSDPGEVMKCYSPEQLPVLVALAKEFAVCDNWHASLPGPTLPNRMFVHAASSGGLDHSPSTVEIIEWESIAHFAFPNGTIFDILQANGITRRLYAGDDFPMASALKGISLDDIRHYSQFVNDLQQPSFPYSYVHIEPSYDVLNNYKNGTSQHPLGDVRRGEALIKSTYEAIRNSSYWPNSMLIITWDEHGGFYDHALPGPAIAPGDTTPDNPHNQNGFTFEQYGPRVPTLVISPLIPQNLIDHRLYDHASIPATIEALFRLAPLTARDRQANRLDSLLTLSTPRTNCPAYLPNPAQMTDADVAGAFRAAPIDLTTSPAARPQAKVNEGNIPVILHAALQQDLQIPGRSKEEVLARVSQIRTQEQARQYLADVQQRIHSHKPGRGEAVPQKSQRRTPR